MNISERSILIIISGIMVACINMMIWNYCTDILSATCMMAITLCWLYASILLTKYTKEKENTNANSS